MIIILLIAVEVVIVSAPLLESTTKLIAGPHP